ncbi:hypothetical protein [Acinetobacter towneri]|uniref:hypothetical protein n=1 Tax=Acinetobacter towneri TaxID=202956 RepID=UPI002096A82A|nr:hypothetical protein [Acinetobacter towneri]MCO8048192.1 hypothetical protein [Acinetobacter towneri]
MSIDNSKNELYGDFVQLVDKVSSTVIKTTVTPLSEQIKIVTDEMQTTSQILKQTSGQIGQIAANTIKEEVLPISEQMESALQIVKKASDNIGKIENFLYRINNNTDSLETQIGEVKKQLRVQLDDVNQKLENQNNNTKKVIEELKTTIYQNSVSSRKDSEKLNLSVTQLSIQIEKFQKKQDKLLYLVIGINILFGFIILAVIFHFGGK